MSAELAIRSTTGADHASGSIEVPLDKVRLGPNVRTGATDLTGLAADIVNHGVLEPVLIGRDIKTGALTLVAGFRRVAAAKLAKLRTIPAIVRDLTPEQALEVQLVENLQREDLSALDEARGFKAYIDATGRTQAELAGRIGKSAPFVSNRLRLLSLPPEVTAQLVAGKISASHAEVLAGIPEDAHRVLIAATKDLKTYRGDLKPVSQLAEEVRWKVQRFREAQKEKAEFAAKLSKWKFPTCPSKDCGKTATRASYYGLGMVTHGGSPHDWDPKNGKLRVDRQGTQREEAKPTLPLVSPDFKCTLAPGDLAWWLQINCVVDEVDVQTRSGKMEFTIRGIRKDAPSLPGFEVGARGGTRMYGADSYSQPTDRDRKRLAEQKHHLEEYLARLAGKAAPRGKDAPKGVRPKSR